MIVTNISQRDFTRKYLNNNEYFSAGNKKFFNVYKTTCKELFNIGFVLEESGEFIRGGESHTSLKVVGLNKNIDTLTSGFSGSPKAKVMYKSLITCLKNLGEDVIKQVIDTYYTDNRLTLTLKDSKAIVLQHDGLGSFKVV